MRAAETLPAHRWGLNQFVTLGEGKSEGTYYGTHFETEAEYGFTDQFQASLSLIQHYFYNKGVDGDRDALDNTNGYRFGGFEGSAKYRVLSPFKDPIGVALRLEGGYLLHDEVDGLDHMTATSNPRSISKKTSWRFGEFALSILARNGPGQTACRAISEELSSKAQPVSPIALLQTGMQA